MKPLPLLTVFLSITFSQTAVAQTPSLSTRIGDEFKISMAEEPGVIFGSESDGFARLGLFGEAIRIEKGVVARNVELSGYDKSLKATYTKKIDISRQQFLDKDLGVYHIGNKHYWIYYGVDKNTGDCLFFANAIDVAKGDIKMATTPFLQTGQIAGVVKADQYRLSGYEEVRLYSSQHKKYLAVVSILKPKREAGTIDEVVLDIHVFDEHFNKWNKQVVVPASGKTVEMRAITLTEKGEAFVLVKKFDKKSGSFDLIHVSGADQPPAFHKVDISAVDYFGGMVLLPLPQSVVITGTYRTEKSKEWMGFYTYTYANKAGKANLYPFDNMDKDETKYLVFAEAIPLEDGSIYLAAEQRITRSSTSGSTYRTGNLISCRIGPEGKLGWMTSIAKKQYSQTFPESVGVRTLEYKNQTVTLFNDSEKNEGKDDDDNAKEAMMGTGKVVLADVVIDTSGKKTKQTQDIGKTSVYPRSLYKISPSSYIGVTQMNNRTYAPVIVELR